MSKDLPRTSHRGYSNPYSIRYAGSQRDRFGVDKRQEIRMMMLDNNDHEDYPENFTGEWDDFPRVSRLRENLTALSQHYNLYFVAYRGWIHVYVPSRGARRLLGEPVAILDPDLSQTPMSAYTVGHVNRSCPHSVNHMKVGDLGDKEILLVARDNGDVVAWYTEPIARQVEDRLSPERRHPPPSCRDVPSGDDDDDEDEDDAGQYYEHDYCDDDGEEEEPRLPSPSHFFADNVGMSAWGLAIHKRDRLIAISSNTQEVTVFAFALGGDQPDAQFERKTPGERGESPDHTAKENPSCHLPVSWSNFPSGPVPGNLAAGRKLSPRTGESIRNLERRFRTRTRAWRIVIPFGQDASNLPSVSFCEDEAGHADRVAALDICGYLFIAEIWTVTSRHIRIPPHNVQYPNGARYDANVMGWSILPVTDAQLLPTKTLKAAIGVDPKDAVYRGKHPARGTWVDVSKSMSQLVEDAASMDHKMRCLQYQPEDFSTVRDGPERELYQSNLRLQISGRVHEPVFDKNEDSDTKLAMTMVPPTGDHYTEFRAARDLVEFAGARGSTRRMLELPSALTLSEFRARNPTSALLRGVSFLRANEEDVEMLTLDHEKHDVGLVCHHVLTNINSSHQLGPWDTQFGRRCSMLLTIPELHLVVLGSMCGRVALLTLTKPPREDGGDDDDPPRSSNDDARGLPRRPRRAFRVDAVLPLKSEEYARPYVCLLGIAVSPVPETGRVTELRRRRPTAPGGRRRRSMGAAGALPELVPGPPRRWRLVLNYMDHTVLQYEITRKEEEEGAAAGGEERLEARARRARAREIDELGVETELRRPFRRRRRRDHCIDSSNSTTDDEAWALPKRQRRTTFTLGAARGPGNSSSDELNEISTTTVEDEEEDEEEEWLEGEGDEDEDEDGEGEEGEEEGGGRGGEENDIRTEALGG